MALNARQQRFVEEYLVDLNATQAAIRSGYSAKTAHAIGHENLNKPEIAGCIKSAQEDRCERMDITVDSITEQLLSIAKEARSQKIPAALSVARQSLMDVAKLNGLVVDKVETYASSAEERRAELYALKAERERLTRTH